MTTENNLTVIKAKTFKQRLCGLITMKLGHHQGLLFANASSLHTFFMKYDLDVLFLDADGKIIKIAKQLKPWRFSLCLKAKHFVEVPSQNNLQFKIGETIPLT